MDNHDVKYSSLPDLSSQSFLVSECLCAVFNLYKLIKFQTIIGFSSLISCVSCDFVEVLSNSMEYISVNCDQCGRLSCVPHVTNIFFLLCSQRYGGNTISMLFSTDIGRYTLNSMTWYMCDTINRAVREESILTIYS